MNEGNPDNQESAGGTCIRDFVDVRDLASNTLNKAKIYVESHKVLLTMSLEASKAPCGLLKACSKSIPKPEVETRALELFDKHLAESKGLKSKINCYPDNNNCPTRADFMIKIENELWFVEHTMLGFDAQVEERIKSAEDFLNLPLKNLAADRNIRIVVSLKFRQSSIPNSELAKYLEAIEDHVNKFDKNQVSVTQTYPLPNGLIDVQIWKTENLNKADGFGNAQLLYSMSLSANLDEQFEIANRASITKKFKEQIKKSGRVQKTALIIDQTYKIKEDGTIFYGNGTYSQQFIRNKVREIAAKGPHQVDQVWLINFQGDVSLLHDWS